MPGLFNIFGGLAKASPPDVPLQNGPWRPPEWSGLSSDAAQLVYMKSNIGGYFFDALIRAEHTTRLKITDHPVQTGANIVDHSYIEPATLVMEIAVSDAMDSMVSGQFTAGITKSVAAYQTLLKLQQTRLPLQVVTRLNVYQNMLIEELTAPEEAKTLYGLRCTVTLKEIFVVEVSKTTVSARPQATGSTARGQQQATKPPPTIARQIEKATTGESGDNGGIVDGGPVE